ncbi:MAG: GTPase [Planctomycetota bacterium]|nr:GTPase [Planctomycetota bacterium]
MPIPRIAIVGRPNVGKSSLLNMMAGAKVSIVDPTPGVTRDRVVTIVDFPHPDGVDAGPEKLAEVIDTGGFGVYTAEGARYDEVGADLATLTDDIESQIAAAIESADLVLFAVDAQRGVTPHDLEIARLLRERRLGPKARHTRGGKIDQAERGARAPHEPLNVRVIATKVDGPKWETHAHELSALGFGEPLMCSAKNNYMRRDLMDKLYELLPARGPEEPAPMADLKLAIVGKRNAGKSTLVNTLAGAPRMIVSEIAGTTRDAVDVRFELDGRSLIAIDTAGLRRKKSFQSMVEWYALERAKKAIDRADVVLMLIDATLKLSQVDEQLAMMCQKVFKPVIIVVNKWDREEGGAAGRAGRRGKPVSTEDYEEYLRRELKGLSFAPIAFMSARTGLNVRATIDLAFELKEQTQTRVTTGQLNRIIRELLAAKAPTDKIGSYAKVYFVTQTRVAPPTITLVVNKPELFTLNYQRYLINRFRELLPFYEVPIRLQIRARRQTVLPQEAQGTLIASAGKVREKALLRAGKKPGEAVELSDDPFADAKALSPDDAAQYFADPLGADPLGEEGSDDAGENLVSLGGEGDSFEGDELEMGELDDSDGDDSADRASGDAEEQPFDPDELEPLGSGPSREKPATRARSGARTSKKKAARSGPASRSGPAARSPKSRSASGGSRAMKGSSNRSANERGADGKAGRSGRAGKSAKPTRSGASQPAKPRKRR